MRRRDPRAFVADMVQAASDIVEALAGISEPAFLADRRLQKAVIRDLEVLGEACRHVPPATPRLAPHIPWRKVSAMRNRLIHGYFDVDPRIVFRTAIHDVPASLPQLTALARRLDQADGGE